MRLAPAALGLLLPCCAPPEPQHLAGRTMGTTYSIKYVGSAAPGALQRQIDAHLAAFARVFSTYDPTSEISRFNADRDGEPFQASPAFAAALRLALRFAEASDGAFDPTVLPLLRALGLGPGGADAADAAAVAAARARTGFSRLRIDDRGRVVRTQPDVEITLDAIAPGIAVDEVGALLGREGITSFMVEIGGEVLCRGEKAPGAPWQIGIEKPGDDGGILHVAVPLRDRALATSGSYRRFVESGGRRRHHIVDPRTGDNPAHAVVSVSVEARDCVTADALSTTLMVVGPKGAQAVLERAGDPTARALFLLQDKDGTLREARARW